MYLKSRSDELKKLLIVKSEIKFTRLKKNFEMLNWKKRINVIKFHKNDFIKWKNFCINFEWWLKSLLFFKSKIEK